MKQLQNIDIETIEVRATAGAPITDAVGDALAFCADQKHNVVLIHNTSKYTINYYKLMECVVVSISKDAR